MNYLSCCSWNFCLKNSRNLSLNPPYLTLFPLYHSNLSLLFIILSVTPSIYLSPYLSEEVQTLQLLFYKLSLKVKDHCSRSMWGPGPSRSKLGSKISIMGLPSNFCLIKFLPKCTADAPEPHQARWSGERVSNLTKKLLGTYNANLILWNPLHGSRRTWGQGPSRSGFGVQKGELPPINQGCPATFV